MDLSSNYSILPILLLLLLLNFCSIFASRTVVKMNPALLSNENYRLLLMNGTKSSSSTGAKLQDSNQMCCSWASMNECENNPQWMNDNCAVSCTSTKCLSANQADNVVSHLQNGNVEVKIIVSKAGQNLVHNNTINNIDDVVDRHRQCCEWAGQKECTTNAVWMGPNCRRSCLDSVCLSGSASKEVLQPHSASTSDKSIKDLHLFCCEWASLGECNNNKEYMSRACGAACNPQNGCIVFGSEDMAGNQMSSHTNAFIDESSERPPTPFVKESRKSRSLSQQKQHEQVLTTNPQIPVLAFATAETKLDENQDINQQTAMAYGTQPVAAIKNHQFLPVPQQIQSLNAQNEPLPMTQTQVFPQSQTQPQYPKPIQQWPSQNPKRLITYDTVVPAPAFKSPVPLSQDYSNEQPTFYSHLYPYTGIKKQPQIQDQNLKQRLSQLEEKLWHVDYPQTTAVQFPNHNSQFKPPPQAFPQPQFPQPQFPVAQPKSQPLGHQFSSSNLQLSTDAIQTLLKGNEHIGQSLMGPTPLRPINGVPQFQIPSSNSASSQLNSRNSIVQHPAKPVDAIEYRRTEFPYSNQQRLNANVPLKNSAPLQSPVIKPFIPLKNSAPLSEHRIPPNQHQSSVFQQPKAVAYQPNLNNVVPQPAPFIQPVQPKPPVQPVQQQSKAREIYPVPTVLDEIPTKPLLPNGFARPNVTGIDWSIYSDWWKTFHETQARIKSDLANRRRLEEIKNVEKARSEESARRIIKSILLKAVSTEEPTTTPKPKSIPNEPQPAASNALYPWQWQSMVTRDTLKSQSKYETMKPEIRTAPKSKPIEYKMELPGPNINFIAPEPVILVEKQPTTKLEIVEEHIATIPLSETIHYPTSFEFAKPITQRDSMPRKSTDIQEQPSTNMDSYVGRRLRRLEEYRRRVNPTQPILAVGSGPKPMLDSQFIQRTAPVEASRATKSNSAGSLSSSVPDTSGIANSGPNDPMSSNRFVKLSGKKHLCCFWTLNGQCEANPYWMNDNCRAECSGTITCSKRVR